MSEYDKELDTRTEEYDEAIEPLDRETHAGKTAPRERDDDDDDSSND